MVVSAVAMVLMAVELDFYLRGARRFGRWYACWTGAKHSQCSPFWPESDHRDFSRIFGIVAVAAWRVVLAVYLAALVWIVGPIILKLLTLSLCTRMIRAG